MIMLYCFTGTGNSLATARQLTELLDDDCRIELMPDLLKQHIIEPESNKIGLVFPVYAWSMPKLVKRFVRRLFIADDSYVFAVYTSGGSPGATGMHLNKLLNQKKSGLNAGFNVTMPSNYTPFGLLSEEKCKSVLSEAESKIEKIARLVNSQVNNHIERTRFFWPLASLINPMFMSQLNNQKSKFNVNASCCSCGMCEKVCPNENIRLENGKPSWSGNCDLCLACLHWCPVAAIEYGRASRNGRRYHHPDINVYDLIAPDKRRKKIH